MRKLLFSLFTMLSMATLVLAVEVTVVKYDKDKKEVTVKEGEKETTYKITDKVKVTLTDKDGKETEGKFEDLEKRWANIGKDTGKGGGKGGGRNKIDVTVKDGTITEVKARAFGGKGKNDN